MWWWWWGGGPDLPRPRTPASSCHCCHLGTVSITAMIHLASQRFHGTGLNKIPDVPLQKGFPLWPPGKPDVSRK